MIHRYIAAGPEFGSSLPSADRECLARGSEQPRVRGHNNGLRFSGYRKYCRYLTLPVLGVNESIVTSPVGDSADIQCCSERLRYFLEAWVIQLRTLMPSP